MTALAIWRYNVFVPAAGPKRQLEQPQSEPKTRHVYTLETTGLLVIAVLVLFLTLIRYWHNVSWSAR